MHLHFLGTGDAFGSGGRFNTCFLVERGEMSLLIDCGASSLIAMRRFGADPNSIAAILISHLHGDHFGGLPIFILDAQVVSRRARPLRIIGPRGMAARVEALMDAAYPDAWKAARGFAIEMVEIDIRERAPIAAANAAVTGFPMRHPSGAPSLALRCECDGRVITYSGDTEWTEELIAAGRAADLLIVEASTFDRQIPFHLSYATLRENLPQIGAKRVVLTHMSSDMLERDADSFPDCERAFDGMKIEL
jgi:ribonuclease BN (tRNA processing enzyme)